MLIGSTKRTDKEDTMSSSGKELENIRLKERIKFLEQQVGDLTVMLDSANAKLRVMTRRCDLWQKRCVSLGDEQNALFKEIKAFNKDDKQ